MTIGPPQEGFRIETNRTSSLVYHEDGTLLLELHHADSEGAREIARRDTMRFLQGWRASRRRQRSEALAGRNIVG